MIHHRRAPGKARRVSLRASLTVMALALLGGCSAGGDAELQPGMYEMKLGGGFAGITLPGLLGPPASLPDRICLEGSPEHYPARLMRPYMRLHDGCGEASLKREGGRLTGVAVCPLDPGRAPGGSVTMLLSGDVTGDSVDAEISTRWDLGAATDPELAGAAKLFQSTTLRVTAKYLGACDASSAPPPRKQASHAETAGTRSDTDAGDTAAPEIAPVEAEIDTAPAE